MIFHMMMLISITVSIFSRQLLLTEGNRGGGGVFSHDDVDIFSNILRKAATSRRK